MSGCVSKPDLENFAHDLQPDMATLVSGGRLRGGLALSVAGVQAEAGAEAEAERALYRLVAVVVHVGGPRSGHFATYRRGNGFESKRYVRPEGPSFFFLL